MSTTPQPQPPSEEEPNPTPTLPMLTNHCRFCNHLLLATTHSLPLLPRRKEPALDGALILPLPAPSATSTTTTASTSNAENSAEKGQEGTTQAQAHYSILLSTAIPDRRATMVRREDGFEKRWFLRCGRCRVVVGYFLDAVHFPASADKGQGHGQGQEEDGENDEAERAKVVYLLPGALVETEDMGNPEKMKAIDREWSGWIP